MDSDSIRDSHDVTHALRLDSIDWTQPASSVSCVHAQRVVAFGLVDRLHVASVSPSPIADLMVPRIARTRRVGSVFATSTIVLGELLTEVA
jgi:hypothetical protein